MNQKNQKIIVPIIVAILLILYYVLYFAILIAMLPGILIKILFVIVPLALAGVTIYVCVQRIQEIRSGEEDDLSKY
ncbi:MAG: hypothetical protein IJP29_03910 [Lachnospiraceae bacterium]|nr:hypothetical protein [Lachnospiraceae bacterium]